MRPDQDVHDSPLQVLHCLFDLGASAKATHQIYPNWKILHALHKIVVIGIRDMSVLEEPPMDRLPIQTYVMEYNDEIVREAVNVNSRIADNRFSATSFSILLRWYIRNAYDVRLERPTREYNDEIVREAVNRELARGGQVYYVFNRVNQIVEVTSKVAELVPDANVAFAHGQMKERELENIMYRFIHDISLDRKPVHRRLLQDAHVTDSNQAHMKRSWNRRRRQRQDIDSFLHLLNFFLMSHPKPLLLINNQKTQIFKRNVFRQTWRLPTDR